jgi:hypothetical protein
MRNSMLLLLLFIILGAAILIGRFRDTPPRQRTQQERREDVPHIGRIQVLNGCGITGAANAVADFLRRRSFDVKNIGNADMWNYPFTMVVSRSLDMSIARQVSEALGTDKLILMRTDEDLYNVTVILGPDFGERIE